MDEFQGIYSPRSKRIRIKSVKRLRELVSQFTPKTEGIPLKGCREIASTIESVPKEEWPDDLNRREILADTKELKILCDEIEKLLGVPEVTGPAIGMKSFKLGRLVERILVRQFEPYVKTARKIKENPESGARRTPKLEGVSNAAIRNEVDLLIKKGLGKVAACRKVALKHGVSASTIRRRYMAP